MTDAATIRPATEDDAEAIQRVARVSWHAAYDSIIGPEAVEETIDSWYDQERVVADDVHPDDRPFFVAEEDETLVGFVEGVPDEADERTFHLYRIYVAPDHWGQGVGGSLLDHLERHLQDDGIEQLRLSVHAENEVGVQFYETKGFERVTTTADKAFGGDQHEYAKKLD